MKFTLNESQYLEFVRNLSLIQKVVSEKNVLLKITCCNKGVILSAYGVLGKLQITILVDISAIISGESVVQEDFIKLVKNLSVSKEDLVTFSISKTNTITIKISNSKSKYSVKSLSLNTMDTIHFDVFKNSIEVPSVIVYNGLQARLFCKTDETALDVFNAINMSVTPSEITFIASDTSTLFQIQCNKESDQHFNLLIPTKVAVIIQSILSSESNNIKLGITTTGHGLILTKSVTYLFSPITGTYPDVSKITFIPSIDYISVLSTNLFEKVSLVNNLSEGKIIHFKINQESLFITNTDTDLIDIEEIIDASYTKEHSFYLLLKPLLIFLSQFKSHNNKLLIYVDKRIIIKTTVANSDYIMVTNAINIK